MTRIRLTDDHGEALEGTVYHRHGGHEVRFTPISKDGEWVKAWCVEPDCRSHGSTFITETMDLDPLPSWY